ncbi:hypothetical protein BKA66DRAFT_380857, partial [Pyrenochaeta sp. MPI-SDFR-AT-0127]
IGNRRHRLSAQTIRQLLIVKYGNIDEEETSSIARTSLEEDQILYEEVDDLFELPAQVDFEEDQVQEDRDGEELCIVEDSNDVGEGLQPPPRKRQR